MKKSILYVCYGGGHVNMIVPLFREIQETHPEFEQTILALTGAGAQLEKLNIPYLSFKDFVGDNEQALKYGRKLLAEIKTPQIVSNEESIAYLGLSFLELVEDFGYETAFEMYQKNGRSVFLPLKTLEGIIKKLDVNLVISTASPRAEMASLLAANKLGIKSICLFDVYDRNAISKYLAKPQYGTYICAPDSYSLKELISHGRPEAEIIVTGNPAFDVLLDPKYEETQRIFRKKHALEDKKVILWARSAFPMDVNVSDHLESALINFVNENEDYSLIVRTHPNEARRDLPQSPRVLQSFGAEDPLATVLHASDIVVNLYSTVGIEAHLIGKKVIQFTSTASADNVNYVGRGIATGAKDIDELNVKLKEPIKVVEKVDRKIAKATPKVIALIESLLL